MDSDYTFEHRNVELLGEPDDPNDPRMRFKCVYPRRVDPELLNLLPIVSYKGEITLVENDDQLDAELPNILRERVLGFDTETRPNFSKLSLIHIYAADELVCVDLGGRRIIKKIFFSSRRRHTR